MIIVDFIVDTYGWTYNNRFYAKGQGELNSVLDIVRASHMGSYAEEARQTMLQNRHSYGKTANSRGGLSTVQLTVASASIADWSAMPDQQ